MDPEALAVAELQSIFERLEIAGEVRCSASEGKYVCASRPIHANEVILSELPIASWPLTLFCPPPPPPPEEFFSTDALQANGEGSRPASESAGTGDGSCGGAKEKKKGGGGGVTSSSSSSSTTTAPPLHPTTSPSPTPSTRSAAMEGEGKEVVAVTYPEPPRALQTCFYCLRRRAIHPAAASSSRTPSSSSQEKQNVLPPPKEDSSHLLPPEDEWAGREDDEGSWSQCARCHVYFCSHACRHMPVAAALHQLLCGPARAILTDYCHTLASPVTFLSPPSQEKSHPTTLGLSETQEGITLEALARCAALLLLRIGVVVQTSGISPQALRPRGSQGRAAAAAAGTSPPSPEATLRGEGTYTKSGPETKKEEEEEEEACRVLQAQIFHAASAPFNRLLGASTEVVAYEFNVDVWKRAVQEALWQTAPAYLNACAAAIVAEGSAEEGLPEAREGASAGAPPTDVEWCRPLIQAALAEETLETLLSQLMLNAHAINTVLYVEEEEEAIAATTPSAAQRRSAPPAPPAAAPSPTHALEDDEEYDEEEEEPQEEEEEETTTKLPIPEAHPHHPHRQEKPHRKGAPHPRNDSAVTKEGGGEPHAEKPSKESHLPHPKHHRHPKKRRPSLQTFISSSLFSLSPSFKVVVKGAGIYSLLSVFNHSCEPNVHVTHPYETNEIQLMALREIPVGEQLTISYIPVSPLSEEERAEEEGLLDDTKSTEERLRGKNVEEIKKRVTEQRLQRRLMLRQYFFECHCTRCEREERLLSVLHS